MPPHTINAPSDSLQFNWQVVQSFQHRRPVSASTFGHSNSHPPSGALNRLAFTPGHGQESCCRLTGWLSASPLTSTSRSHASNRAESEQQSVARECGDIFCLVCINTHTDTDICKLSRARSAARHVRKRVDPQQWPGESYVN